MALSRHHSFAIAMAVAALASGATARSMPRQRAGSVVATPHTSVAVIVNKANPVNQLSVSDLRRMLLGDVTRWPDGRKITIALREPGQPERDALLRLICRMSEQDFTRYTLHVAYRGEAQGTVKQLDTPSGVRRFVFNVPGAIGFVRADELDDSVKVLQIAGTTPEASAFGLTLRTR